MSKPKTPMIDRFRKLFIVDKESGCWIWIGCTNNDGYGTFCCDDSKVKTASRVSMELHLGRILLREEHVLHNCPKGDNIKCVNPDHLFIGTHQDNMRDKSVKWKTNTNLSLEDVLRIRELRKEGLTLEAIGKRYKKNPATICKIIKRKLFKYA